ncbi:MAG UNVERIFIED_CONTAM: hypothetical protein LVR18_44480 [Planctomycetaceae bacterium]|jgi:hypothetical protein
MKSSHSDVAKGLAGLDWPWTLRRVVAGFQRFREFGGAGSDLSAGVTGSSFPLGSVISIANSASLTGSP